MKQLIMVNGTMGVGKTTTSKQLAKLLQPSVFLDGDWCWDMHPFIVNEETKAMVLRNITFQLRQFLACDEFAYVIFCWVMHEQEIIDEICKRLDLQDVNVSHYSIVCEEAILKERLMKDVNLGLRKPELIERTIARLPRYQTLDTIKIDVSHCTSMAAATMIAEDVRKKQTVL